MAGTLGQTEIGRPHADRRFAGGSALVVCLVLAASGCIRNTPIKIPTYDAEILEMTHDVSVEELEGLSETPDTASQDDDTIGPEIDGEIVEEPECADQICEGEESCNSCPEDCGPCCGNNVCEKPFGENCHSCVADCGECAGDCCNANQSAGCEVAQVLECMCESVDPYCCGLDWDEMCVLEAQFQCGLDCCGDGDCDEDVGETACSCPADCETCPGDCGCAEGKVCFEQDCCTPNCGGKKWGLDGCGACCGKIEVCDGQDNDCDGLTDPEGADGCKTFYQDGDVDGYGYKESYKCLCGVGGEAPFTAAEFGDCNDSNSEINPGVKEICNQIDDDCDDDVDNTGADGCVVKYKDDDNDGYGLSEDKACVCGTKGTYSASLSSDCDDNDKDVHPFAAELCNEKDDNCDSVIDEEDSAGCEHYYFDADGDDYWDTAASKCLCSPFGLYTAPGENGGDCNDSDLEINPGEPEICDGKDNDCDAEIDEDDVCCDPPCDAELEECTQATTGEWMCAARMVVIPAGYFWMGCNEALDQVCTCPGKECDYHQVITEKYWVDVTEVTNAQYVEFLNAHGNLCNGNECVDVGDGDEQVEEDGGLWSAVWAKDAHPVVEITWFGAKAYCEWRCPTCRLCSESEWEKAARGGSEKYANCKLESRIWPWGNEFPSSCDGTTAAYFGCNCSGGTCEVGTHPGGKSAYKIHDMGGNVSEWVEDSYHTSYSGAPTDGSAWIDPLIANRVRRGGNKTDALNELRVSRRLGYGPQNSFDRLGTRCCRSE